MKIKLPVYQGEKRVGWTFATAEQIVESALAQGIDEEVFKYNLKLFRKESLSPRGIVAKFNVEALSLYRRKQSEATRSVDINKNN